MSNCSWAFFLTIAFILQLLEEQGEVIEQEKLPSIDDTFNQLEVAEYVDEIYEYYWVLEVIALLFPFHFSGSLCCIFYMVVGVILLVVLIELDAIILEKISFTGTPIF